MLSRFCSILMSSGKDLDNTYKRTISPDWGVNQYKSDRLTRMRAEIVQALAVLNTRDHFNIPEDTLTERANNLIQILNSEFGLEYKDKQ